MKVSKKDLRELYRQMGLIECQTEVQEKNGTLVFFDDVANCKFIFRRYSNPRVEYLSTKTNSVQSYEILKNVEYHRISYKMIYTISVIQSRKIKGVKDRTKIALDIFQKLIK